jgi:hypothetical protein
MILNVIPMRGSTRKNTNNDDLKEKQEDQAALIGIRLVKWGKKLSS